MNIEKVVLPTNGLVKYPREVYISAMRGRHLSTILSSLDDGAVDKVIEDIIEPKISITELTDEDKTFILHKARTLTFGNEIKQTLKCPVCGDIHEYTLNYEDFDTIYLREEDVGKELIINVGGKEYAIINKIPTGETWEEVEQYKRRYKPVPTLAYILIQAAHISTINGRGWTMAEKVNFLADELPANLLVEVAQFLDVKYGFDPTYLVECHNTGTAFTGGLAITADLFR